MLHKETVEQSTLELITKLQQEPELQGFNLVGGTALALKIGHRKSIDIDLFTTETFDLPALKTMLTEKYGLRTSFERDQTLKGFINGVMIDCIKFGYPHINSPEIIDNIRLESTPDIIAMKLSAIAQNGTRIKDFIDIAYLSHKYTLNEMLYFYQKKFPQSNAIMPAKALTYFDEIDFEESIMMISGKFEWEKIAKRLTDMTKYPIRIFTNI